MLASNKFRKYLQGALFPVLVFIFIITSCWNHFGTARTAPDTRSHIHAEILNPFLTFRTPGYSWYVRIFADLELLKKKPLKPGETPEPGSEYIKITRVTIILYALSLSLLAASLALFIKPWFAAAFVAGAWFLFPGPPPQNILADQPAFIFCVLGTACGLTFFAARKIIWLFLLTCCAVIAGLIKPVMIFMSLIAGIICAIAVIRSLFHKNYRLCAGAFLCGIFLCSGTLAWPLWVSYKAGFFLTSQISATHLLMDAIWLLEPKDVVLFEGTEYKPVVEDMIRLKAEMEPEIEKRYFPKGFSQHSGERRHSLVRNYYGYDLFARRIMRIYSNKLSELRDGSRMGYLKVMNAITKPVIKAHRKEYYLAMPRSFLAGFGSAPDFRPDMFGNFPIGIIKNHPVVANLCMTGIMALAPVFGVPALRAPLLLLLCIHPLDIAFMAIGNHVIYRYVVVTSWSWALAFFLAVYSLASILFLKFSNRSFRLGEFSA